MEGKGLGLLGATSARNSQQQAERGDGQGQQKHVEIEGGGAGRSEVEVGLRSLQAVHLFQGGGERDQQALVAPPGVEGQALGEGGVDGAGGHVDDGEAGQVGDRQLHLVGVARHHHHVQPPLRHVALDGLADVGGDPRPVGEVGFAVDATRAIRLFEDLLGERVGCAGVVLDDGLDTADGIVWRQVEVEVVLELAEQDTFD